MGWGEVEGGRARHLTRWPTRGRGKRKDEKRINNFRKKGRNASQAKSDDAQPVCEEEEEEED